MAYSVVLAVLAGFLLMAGQGTVQAQPAQQTAAVGSVASVRGTATVTRNASSIAPKTGDAIFKGDIIETGSPAAVAITFDDETTLQLGDQARIVVDEFLYEEGGSNNSAVFNIVRGAVAFAANEIAKTGDMKMETPTAVLGIRGTTGVVEVPEGTGVAANAGEVTFKLYPDADGGVGRMEVFAPGGGTRLGVLTQGATGFAIRRSGAQQFAAVALRISALEAARDRALVRQVFSSQRVGRQMVRERRSTRQPGLQRLPQRQPNLQPRPGSPDRRESPRQPAEQTHAPHQQGPVHQPAKPSEQRSSPRSGLSHQPLKTAPPVKQKRKH